jgi:hypothetical protein
MHPRLALIDGDVRFRVSSTDIEPNLYGRLSFLGDWFNNIYLFVHGNYTR